MKVAFVGAGHIATVHGPIVNSTDASLVAIADQDISRARALAAGFDNCKPYDDAREMLEMERPDVVHILTSPGSHAFLAIMAMELGCHVLVEKPMALNGADAERMMAAAKANNVQICVNHNMVYESVVRRARAIEESGVIGKVVSVEAVYQFDPRRYPAILEEGAQYAHWTYGLNGGPLQDLMPHPAALIAEYCNEIINISSIGTNRGVLPEPWQDEIRVMVKADSCLGSISISLSEKPDIILFIIKGTCGIIQADLYNDNVIVRRKSILPRAAARALSGFSLSWQHLKGALRNIYVFATGKIDKSNGVAPLVARFYGAINGTSEPPFKPEKSMQAVQIMDAIWPEPVVQPVAQSQSSAITGIKDADCLVTGASGFIGIHLIKKLLAENRSVRAIVRPNSQNRGRLHHLGVEIVEGDLADKTLLQAASKGIETVFHAGSPMSSNWQDFERIAVQGTEDLLQACVENKVKRFVQFSSLAVYEFLQLKERLINEDSQLQLNPKLLGPYAWAKIETERMAMDVHRQHGLGVSIVRPGMVIGPMGRIFFPHLGYNLGESVFLVIGNGDMLLPLTYVENCVDCIYLAATREEAVGRAYNIVDDGLITVNDYLGEFINTSGGDGKIIHLPYALPWGATLTYEIVSSLGLLKKGATSRAQLKWKQAKVRIDNSRAKNELGWQMALPIEQGMKNTFEWYVEKYS